MKLLLLLATITTVLSAQGQLSTAVSPTTAKAGDTVTVFVSYPTADPTGMATVQWTIALPWSAITATRGAAAVTAAKTLTVNGTKAVVYGKNPVDNTLNLNVIPTGVLATYTVPIPATAAAGNYTITVSNIQGVSSSSAPLPLTLGPVAVLSLLSSYDVNNDGAINYFDVDAATDQAVGRAACGTADVNLDGKCDTIDIQLVTRKALGL